MKTEEIELRRLVENEDNPRQITAAQFQKLLQSIIVFPRMLTLRPVVVDETFKALGGNMRLKALRHIASMDERGINRKLDDEGERLSNEQRNLLLAYWQDWQQHPTVTIVKADDLTERQKAEFIAKDNISYGAWDYDQLANSWDNKTLQGWGMAIWNDQSLQTDTTEHGNGGGCGTTTGTGGSAGEGEGDGDLPSELDGLDLSPDPLEDIEGDEQTPMENIIIKYRKEDAEAVAKLLGIAEISKIIYRFEDLPSKEGGENE